MTTPRHAHTPRKHVQTLVDFCLANHPDIQDVAGLTEDEIRQAARLIAAAPEMLSMLEDVQSWLETNLALGNINAGTANRDGDLVSQLRHAIARATGRERGE